MHTLGDGKPAARLGSSLQGWTFPAVPRPRAWTPGGGPCARGSLSSRNSPVSTRRSLPCWTGSPTTARSGKRLPTSMMPRCKLWKRRSRSSRPPSKVRGRGTAGGPAPSTGRSRRAQPGLRASHLGSHSGLPGTCYSPILHRRALSLADVKYCGRVTQY